MFRSKSFSTPKTMESESLTRKKSYAEPWPKSIDIRCSIVIKKVSLSDASKAMQEIKDKTMNDEWLSSNFSGQLDEEQTKWNFRYKQAWGIFNFLYSDIDDYIKLVDDKKLVDDEKLVDDKKGLFFVAYFRGVPIGILQLIFTNEMTKIVFLATHCGIRGCGVLLIEYVVNELQQLGKDRRLTLFPYKNARPAYIAMGFTGSEREMMLDPTTSDKWLWDNKKNRYTYKFI
ncbi:GNAT family N-acetyltransferase [Xenorhabdus bharatensis]|uniref:GNAT family N-acetyltransferase n=1 Tax=Xenorhabdus bharatensis TaxID=3136256 RepID=UPI0030F3AA89